MKKFLDPRDDRVLHWPSIHVSQRRGALPLNALPLWSEPGNTVLHGACCPRCTEVGLFLCSTWKGMPTGLCSGVPCGEPPALPGAASSLAVPPPRCASPHPSCWQAEFNQPGRGTGLVQLCCSCGISDSTLARVPASSGSCSAAPEPSRKMFLSPRYRNQQYRYQTLPGRDICYLNVLQRMKEIETQKTNTAFFS